MGKPFDLLFVLLLCRRRKKHFDVQFYGLDPYHFRRKMEKVRVYEIKNGRRGVYFPPESAFFPLI